MSRFRMMESPNTSSAANICKLCNERLQLYTCPRCGIGYCSVECYKSDVHVDCSESFYKQCIEDELKAQENDPTVRQKMVEILKRVHDADLDVNLEYFEDESSDEGDFTLDSDDEQELADLATRLENVNVEDPNELWSALSDAERQEFEALLKNGEAEKLLPKWTPWWTHRIEKKLIELIEEDSKNAYSDLIHPALIDVSSLNELQKASPCVQFNVTNVIYAYAYVALYYYGDYLSCAVDATNVFLLTCENMRNNKVFEDMDSAIKSVIENINNNDWLPQDEQTIITLKEAGASILHGPGTEMRSLYVSAAFSDLHRLLTAAKKEIPTDKSANSNQEFTKRFPQNCYNNIHLSKKSIFLYLKKIEYYLSWVKSYGTVFV